MIALRLLLLLAAATLPGCAAGAPLRPEDAADPSLYGAAQDPEGKAAWQRAQAALATGQRQAALADLQLAGRRCPDLVRAHLAWQDAARALAGAQEEQMRTYYAALPDGGTPVAAYVKARLLATAFEKDQALDAIMARDATFGWARLSRGRIRRDQGRLSEAVDEFEKAVAFDASLNEARLERGDALGELGRLEEAALDYEAYFARAAGDWVALREYAAMLIYRLIRIDRALQLLDRLDAQFPGDLELRMHRGAALWRAFRVDEALPHYLAVLDADPGYARAALDIGLIYYDALPQDEAGRRKWWPRAALAFRYFLALGNPRDGHEAFERALAVPFRLDQIEQLLGPEVVRERTISVDDLRPPPG